MKVADMSAEQKVEYMTTEPIGLLGVQMCQTVSDVLTFSLSVPLCLSVLKELK